MMANTAAEMNRPRRNHPTERAELPLTISSRPAGISPPNSTALSSRRRASPRLKDRKGMETTASTTAATMPVRAPTTAPSPALSRPGVAAARSLAAMAAPPTIQRQQMQLPAPMNGSPERSPATAPAMRAGRRYSGLCGFMGPP